MIGLAKIVLWVVLISSEPSVETVTPLPTPEPPPVVEIKPEPHWLDIWPEHLHSSVNAIVHCESTHNPNAVGDYGASLGLFQLWRGHFTPEEIQSWDNPIVNSQVAYRVYRREGFRPWTCARKLGIS